MDLSDKYNRSSPSLEADESDAVIADSQDADVFGREEGHQV